MQALSGVILNHIPHPKLSHKENWSFEDLELANIYSLYKNETLTTETNINAVPTH
jgi:hypothetical protein